MTCNEFSDQFDTLVDSYKRFKDFDRKEVLDSIDFDEYEKSVFLTKGQEEIIKELYSGRNNLGESFENTEELRRYLSSLIRTEYPSPDASHTENTIYEKFSVLSNSRVFTLPNDVFFITYEAVELGSFGECFSGNTIKVVPTTQDELSNVLENPFRGPSKRRALRLDLANNKVEVISKYPIYKYIVRYIAKPTPIVLEDFIDGLSINGIANKTECSLNPALHQVILDRAVRLALISRLQNENTGSK